jgi:MinD-like ATPase involved in chromosome partitioning or flagellar assembly
VELPTYTNIWKIEKRLYKLYDFRLPMPLPVGQIAAYLAIALPYMLILTMAGMPFSHTWLWVYVLPPGVLAWLVTRPVLEGKRLPELVGSQLRYVSEPTTWCRMAPLAEKDDMVLTARVWRSARYVRPASQAASAVAGPAAVAARPAVAAPSTATTVPAASTAAGTSAAAGPPAWAGKPAAAAAASRVPAAAPRPAWPGSQQVRVRERGIATGPAGNGKPAWPHAGPASRIMPGGPEESAAPPGMAPPLADPAVSQVAAAPPSAPAAPASAGSAPGAPPPAAPAQVPQPRRPVVRVTGEASATRPLNVVERALRTPPGATGIRAPVVVVPGGHRPGKPDQVQKDLARVRLALPGPARVVVLGCTGGAGQTMTTLLTGQLLASLRGEAVAVLDLGKGEGSLTEQARLIPVLVPKRRVGSEPASAADAGERGLQVVTAAESAEDPGQMMSAVAARYPLTLADPDASSVPRALRAADQIVLVAPATADAAGSLAMTLEWLEAHGHAARAAAAITVLNGVSATTTAHAEKAAAVVSGRCRAIVRVPWDDHMRARQPLASGTIQAYTALAGVLVAGLAEAAPAEAGPAGAGRTR